MGVGKICSFIVVELGVIIGLLTAIYLNQREEDLGLGSALGPGPKK